MSRVIQQSWEELSNLTDGQIAMLGWSKSLPAIGDAKDFSFVLDGKAINITMELVGIKHDDLKSGGKVNMTFLCKNVYLQHEVNRKDTNKGGWGKSDLRKWLNTIVFDSFPNELKNVIKPVVKISDTGSIAKNYFEIGEKAVEQKTFDKLWIPSCSEVGFDILDANLNEQGNMYPVFEFQDFFDNGSKRINRYKNSTDNWWLRSSDMCSLGNFQGFHCVSCDGYGDCYNVADSISGVRFGFCI